MIVNLRKSIALRSVLLLATFSCGGKETSRVQTVPYDSLVLTGNYTIRAIHSSLCLDLAGNSPAEGLVLQQYSCNGTSAQIWKVTRLEWPWVTITNAANGKALEITDASLANGARLIQKTPSAHAIHQQFSIEGGGGRLTIRARHSGKVLDILGVGTGNGVAVQQWKDYKSANQLWAFTAVESTPIPTQPQPQPLSAFAELLSEAQFNQMFPNRDSFYTYRGLEEAVEATAGLAKEGTVEDRKREIAAMLANGQHESDHFRATREYNQANWSKYCDQGNRVSPCAPEQQYYGRGPIQLSWNYNYGAAGAAIGADLLRNPDLVATNPKIAWQTMMWYWMTQKGPGSMTPHDAIVKSQSFGETIRSINGALECQGGNSAQVDLRVAYYQNIIKSMGISAGFGNIRC